MNKVYTTDWLATEPVFYNEKTGAISYNINEVIDIPNLEFHPEGFYNYLKFGYSVFGQTPIKHVKFLSPDSEIFLDDTGCLKVVQKEDRIVSLLNKPVKENDVLEMIGSAIRRWEDTATDEIIIPTSGGYDSRLLNFFIGDKSRIRAFSYGPSMHHREMMRGKLLSEILGSRWQGVVLSDFHDYLEEWDSLYGVSTHAHGMYHMEFYNKIMQAGFSGNSFLSGIIGDVWAGNVVIPEIRKPEDIEKLGYTHQLNADADQSKLKGKGELLEACFEQNRYKYKEPLWCIVEAMRMKMILLCLLMKLPRHYGYKPWSPFLEEEIAAVMLNLPAERRQSRLWQTDFFNRSGIGNKVLDGRGGNRKGHILLNAIRRKTLCPLDRNLLGEVVEPRYVDWINRRLFADSYWNRCYDDLMFTPYVKSILGKLGFKADRIRAYFAYMTLKPIENILKKREKVNKK